MSISFLLVDLRNRGNSWLTKLSTWAWRDLIGIWEFILFLEDNVGDWWFFVNTSPPRLPKERFRSRLRRSEISLAFSNFLLIIMLLLRVRPCESGDLETALPPTPTTRLLRCEPLLSLEMLRVRLFSLLSFPSPELVEESRARICNSDFIFSSLRKHY